MCVVFASHKPNILAKILPEVGVDEKVKGQSYCQSLLQLILWEP